jgi:uridine monophosphate synthetase
MAAFKEQIKKVVNQLHDVGGLKFGDYMMKSGRRSPIYVDLRVIISHPKLMVKFLAFLRALNSI